MNDIDLIKHELGHWLLAKKYGFNPEYISIGREGGFTHLFPKPTINDLRDLENYLFQRISGLQAGLVSELIRPTEDEEFVVDILTFEKKTSTTAKGDWDKINELLLIYRGLICNQTKTNQELDDDIQQFCDRCYENSFNIIKENFGTIDEWAEKMNSFYQENKSLRNDLCFEFIDKNNTFEVKSNFTPTI